MKRRRCTSCPEHSSDDPRSSSQQRFQYLRELPEVRTKQRWPSISRQRSYSQLRDNLIDNVDDNGSRIAAGSNFRRPSTRRVSFAEYPPYSPARMRATPGTHLYRREELRNPYPNLRYTPNPTSRRTRNFDDNDFRFYAGQQGDLGSTTMRRAISDDSLMDMISTYGPREYHSSVERPLAILPPPSRSAMSRSFGNSGPRQSLPLVPYSRMNLGPSTSRQPLPPMSAWNGEFARAIPQQLLGAMSYANDNGMPLQMMNSSFGRGAPALDLVPYANARMMNRSFGNGNVSQPLAMVPYLGGTGSPSIGMERSFGATSQPMAMVPFSGGLGPPTSAMNRSFGAASQPMAMVPYSGASAPLSSAMNSSFGNGGISQPLAMVPYLGGTGSQSPTIDRSFGASSQPLAMVPYAGNMGSPTPAMSRSFGAASQPLAMVPYAGRVASSPALLNGATTQSNALVPYGSTAFSPAMNRTQQLGLVPYGTGSAAPMMSRTQKPLDLVPYAGNGSLQRDTSLQNTGVSEDTKRLVDVVANMKTPEQIDQVCERFKIKPGLRLGGAPCCASGASPGSGGSGGTCQAKTNLINVLKVAMKGFENLVRSLKSASGTGDTFDLPDELNDSNRKSLQNVIDTQKNIDKMRKETIEVMQELIGVLSKLVS